KEKFNYASDEEYNETIKVWQDLADFPKDAIIEKWPFAENDTKMETLERDWKDLTPAQRSFRLIFIATGRPDDFVYKKNEEKGDTEDPESKSTKSGSDDGAEKENGTSDGEA